MGLSTDARELYLFILNDKDVQRQSHNPIRVNQRKKIAKGIFRKDLSVKLFRSLADFGTKAYQRQELRPSQRTGFFFSVSVRNEVAKKLADDFAKQEGLK